MEGKRKDKILKSSRSLVKFFNTEVLNREKLERINERW